MRQFMKGSTETNAYEMKRQARKRKYNAEVSREVDEAALDMATRSADEEMAVGHITTEIERQAEINRELESVYPLVKQAHLPFEKCEILKRLVKTLTRRCDRALAMELVQWIDFKHLDEKTLMQVLIEIEKRPTLCQHRERAREEWEVFAAPYHDVIEQQIAIHSAQAEEYRKLQEQEVQARVAAEQKNRELLARIAELEAAKENPAQLSAVSFFGAVSDDTQGGVNRSVEDVSEEFAAQQLR